MSVSSDSEVTDARETDRNPAFIALLKHEIGMTLDSASETTGLLPTKKNRKGAKNRHTYPIVKHMMPDNMPNCLLANQISKWNAFYH
mgnify:CR=1 FL=1|jgi:hypothetical protein